MTNALSLLVAALALTASAEVHLLPAGEFKGRDGRPGKDLSWKLSDEQGRKLAAEMTANHQAVKFNFDYEHQAMQAGENGQPAPASGWASTFEWRDGVGLFATDVKWTDKARQMIEAGEYRYVSPYIIYDRKSGVIVSVINASLVNIPALELNPVATERLAALNASFNASFNPQEIPPMKALLVLLGLSAMATEDEAVAAFTALKTSHQAQVSALNAALGLKPDDGAATAISAIATLKAQAATGDQTTQTTIAALQQQVATLSAAQNERDLKALVDQALLDGKLLPAQKDWATNLGKANLANLQSFLKDAPKVAAGLSQQQSQSLAPATGADGLPVLSSEQQAICGHMGIDPKAYAQTLAKQAAQA